VFLMEFDSIIVGVQPKLVVFYACQQLSFRAESLPDTETCCCSAWPCICAIAPV
jgi:hypothetical protein